MKKSIEFEFFRVKISRSYSRLTQDEARKIIHTYNVTIIEVTGVQ